MKARWPVYGWILRILLWIEHNKSRKWGLQLLILFTPPVFGLCLIGKYPDLAVLLR